MSPNQSFIEVVTLNIWSDQLSIVEAALTCPWWISLDVEADNKVHEGGGGW